MSPIYLVCKLLHPRDNITYNSGGAGYILSEEALRRFVEIGIPDPMCKEDLPDEDLGLGKCLQILNVTAGDSTDQNGNIPKFCI